MLITHDTTELPVKLQNSSNLNCDIQIRQIMNAVDYV